MELVGNAYQIQGVDVLQLAKEHGSPLFVYDAEVIKRQYDRLNIAISYNL
jgi:diaminopimelate decarboxylase